LQFTAQDVLRTLNFPASVDHKSFIPQFPTTFLRLGICIVLVKEYGKAITLQFYSYFACVAQWLERRAQ
jgi:hypothetical protein